MRQERKVVTVLFCDLVGFTSRAEEMDPEDVAALLAPYQARLKDELERYGGTVEKFIGDAVMALFGAPTAHEDDPERAVRAALAIRDFAEGEGIELRIGIGTGDALVTLGARPEAGETMAAGDVVNTSARLQAAAPVNGVLVSQSTFVATKDVIAYNEAAPVRAKGKARPVPVWQAIAASAAGERAHTTPLVGRERELELLRASLARARDDGAAQLLTLVGVPGIGKSRLVHELVRGDGGFSWRKGRCLPYGEGVTFWALGEVVKAHLGILDSDAPEEAEEKLLAAVDDPWLAENLRPLVGLGEARQEMADRRAETFAAWRHFLSALAEDQPLALILEDLHWADDALLDFVTHLFEWTSESPLLLLCTARPELLDRRPGWGANEPRALTIPLAPLSDEETAELLSALVEGPAGDELLAFAGGNPLYAEQYARLVSERGVVDELPATVQGIIAARLDGLPADAKELVQDAAVIGRVFWSGAVAALGRGDRWSVEERLLALERRELVRRERVSSVEGETQYAFRHVLLRDVAYAQIPRSGRGERHRLAAKWVESLGRSGDHAEMLAHHYLSALELARASGHDTTAIELPARRALRDAGDRALSLNAFDAAARFYGGALDLCEQEDRDRGPLLFSWGKAQALARAEGEETLSAAREALLAAGDVETAAEADLLIGDVWRLRAEGDRARAHLDAALALVRERPPSPSKARVLVEASRYRMLSSEMEEAARLGREALSMAEVLGLDEVRAKALGTIGVARMHMGDVDGREDLERSVEIAIELGSVESLRALNNLGAGFVALGDLREAGAAWDRGDEAVRRFGESIVVRHFELNRRLNQGYWSGSWDEAVQTADDVIAEWKTGSPHILVIWAYDVRARIRLGRGDVDGAAEDAQQALEISRRANEPQLLVAVLAFGAVTALASGRAEEAAGLTEELLALHPARRPQSRFSVLFDLSVALSELGREHRLLEETARAEVRTPWVDAAEAYSRGELERAAEVYARTHALPFEAFVRLKTAEKLVSEGQRAEADEQLQRALAFYRSVGATRYIREGEALLAAAS